jgi:hypothetical protein
MLIALGCMEAVHWYSVRQVVSQALMQAARSGITRHAQPEAIAQAFDQSLLLLFPAVGLSSAAFQQQRQYAVHRRLLGAAWHMQIISPAAKHFAAYADPTLPISRQTGLPAIPNSYQLEQHQRNLITPAPAIAQWAPAGSPTIFQANTLVLRVVYPHSPLLPGIRGLFRWLGNDQGNVSQRTFAAGFLPIVQELSLPMQSDPVQWPVSAASGFYSPQSPALDTFGAKNTENRLPCKGVWCQPRHRAEPGSSTTPWVPPGNAAEIPPTHTLPATPGASGPLELPENAAECGVTVCCLTA